MILSINQFYQHLKQKKLLPLYLLSGNVPLLMQEACDALRKTCKHLGYNQRQVFTIETGFDWQTFNDNVNNLSLFSDKSLLELRNPKAKFDIQGTKSLLDYTNNPPEDKILIIIITEKLTAAQQKTRWYKSATQSGAGIMIRPITKYELPQWITTRAKHLNLTLKSESIQLLAELTEGNLLATQQALEKLHLLYGKELITTEIIGSVICDNARFNIFDLANTLLAGQTRQALRCLNNLRSSGVELTLVLWVIARELRELYQLAKKLQQGITLSKVISNQWQMKKPLVSSALKRLSPPAISALLQDTTEIDRIIKGHKTGDAWLALESLCLATCGKGSHGKPQGINYS